MDMINTTPAGLGHNAPPEEFPLTLEACKKRDFSQWDIGDALIVECGPPSPNGRKDGSHKKIGAAAAYLARYGFKYAITSLGRIRQTAYVFPRESCASLRSVGYSVCCQALAPEILRKLIEAHPREPITVEMVRGFREANKAEIARAKRDAKADRPLPRGSEPVRSGPFSDLPRGGEIVPLYSRGRARAMVSGIAKGRGGKEFWALILQAKDAGFITRETNPTVPTIKLLLPDAPLSWAKNHMLDDPKQRAHVRDEIMPAAIANKDAILAEPERIEEILRDHFTRVGHAKKQVVVEAKRAVARAKTEHDDVVLFGKPLWPLWRDMTPDYDFEQLAAAYWSFNDMYVTMLSTGASVPTIAAGIRFSIGRVQKYLTDSQDLLNPFRNKMIRLYCLIAEITTAMEANPNGAMKRPPLP